MFGYLPASFVTMAQGGCQTGRQLMAGLDHFDAWQVKDQQCCYLDTIGFHCNGDLCRPWVGDTVRLGSVGEWLEGV